MEQIKTAKAYNQAIIDHAQRAYNQAIDKARTYLEDDITWARIAYGRVANPAYIACLNKAANPANLAYLIALEDSNDEGEQGLARPEEFEKYLLDIKPAQMELKRKLDQAKVDHAIAVANAKAELEDKTQLPNYYVTVAKAEEESNVTQTDSYVVTDPPSASDAASDAASAAPSGDASSAPSASAAPSGDGSIVALMQRMNLAGAGQRNKQINNI